MSKSIQSKLKSYPISTLQKLLLKKDKLFLNEMEKKNKNTKKIKKIDNSRKTLHKIILNAEKSKLNAENRSLYKSIHESIKSIHKSIKTNRKSLKLPTLHSTLKNIPTSHTSRKLPPKSPKSPNWVIV